MDIASVERDDDHVIMVQKYEHLEEALKKAVEMKIGKSKFK